MFFFDIFLIIIVVYSFYYGYKNGISEKLYELTKVFLGFTIAGSYAYTTGFYLTKVKILSPDNPAIMKLIGFLILFLIYWGLIFFLEYVKEYHFRKSFKNGNMILGAITNTLQVFLAFTLSAFLLTQLSFGKKNIKPFLKKSYSYPKIERVYKRVLTKNFVNNIIKGNMTGTNANELFIQTITNDKVINSVK